MLCYRCGSHVPDTSETCATCGQKLSGGGLRQATGTFSRRRLNSGTFDGAPYKQGDVLSGRYEIRDALGQGPVGFVFRARDKQVDVEVALKVVHARLIQTPDERANFSKAMRVGRKLNHPNIVRIYEEGSDADNPYFTMQHIEGLTLRKIIDLRLSKGQLFSLKEVEPIIGQIAFALDAIHTVGPHANLKPENVIVLPDLLKLSDIQLSLAIPRLPFAQAMKPRKADRYLSPEYIEGQNVDARTDVYALAVILGEMVAGVTPDETIPELSRVVPDLPPALEGLYRRALNPNPLARQKSAIELHEEILRLLGKSSLPPPLPRSSDGLLPVPPPIPSFAPSNPDIPLAPGSGRSRERPGPPIPSDQLPRPQQLKPPAEATQPMSSSELPLVLGSHPEAPVGAKGPREETVVVPSYEQHMPYDGSDVVPPEARQPRSVRTPALFWLVVLTLSGLVTGSLGGYWLLQRIRQSQAADLPQVVDDDSARRADAQRQLELARETARRAEESRKVSTAPAPNREEPARHVEPAAKKDPPKKVFEDPPLPKTIEPLVVKANEPVKEPAKEPAVVPAAVVSPPSALTEEGCPEGMKLVGAGPFRIGTAKDDPMMGFDERMASTVQVAAFCIDVFEYPNKRGVNPMTNVAWADAKKLCEARGRRLCAEDEWEKACKGPGNARFPYGNAYDAEVCNTEDAAGEDRVPTFSGKFTRCRSGYGVADLSGNVAEWTSTPYAGNSDRAQKGGAYDKPDYASRCSARKNGSAGVRSPDVGFRCCADMPAR